MADGGRENSAGFAAVDALTALAILATTIALSIVALSVARRAAAAAAEATTARTTLLMILNDPPRPAGIYAGASSAFDWMLQVRAESPPSAPVRICTEHASLRARTSGRRYDLETGRPCAPERPLP
ncbi:MAG: hypothetical protein Q7T19_14655 [Caulobacter sp.]|nr:hypothetical protein [Caulobacter sp.]